jgi:hypothetical protein
MLLHLFIPCDSSTCTINGCVYKTADFIEKKKIYYLPMIYYIGIALLNIYYYFGPVIIIIDCYNILYMSVYTIYVCYCDKNIETLQTNYDNEYIISYKNLEITKKNFAKRSYQLLLVGIMVEILLHFNVANIIYLFLKTGCKLCMSYHCYNQYLAQLNIKRKKIF